MPQTRYSGHPEAHAFMSEDEVEATTKRITLLKGQVKKHQIFREKSPEAEKQAECGMLYLRLSAEAPADEKKEHMENAAECFSRAKRLCRDVLRNKVD